MKSSDDPYYCYADAVMTLLVAPGEAPGGDAVRVVCGGELRKMDQTAAVLSLATEVGSGLIYLEMPERGAELGPQRLIVFRPTASTPERKFDLDVDGALWAANERAPLLVVSRANDRHFEIGTAGLNEHTGMPAGDLAAGFELATLRIRNAAEMSAANRADDAGKVGANDVLTDSGLINDPELDPDYRLELLSASDPAARASMMRHTVALRSMMTGRLHDRDVAHVLFGANFGSTLEGVEHLKALTGADGRDRIMIGFDVDDPLGAPANFGFSHLRDGVPTFYDQCAPWMPPTSNRVLLIGQNDREIMTFHYKPGHPLVREPGRPARDPWPGIRRAQARLAKLVTTPAVRNAVGDVYLRVAPEGRTESLFTLPGEGI